MALVKPHRLRLRSANTSLSPSKEGHETSDPVSGILVKDYCLLGPGTPPYCTEPRSVYTWSEPGCCYGEDVPLIVGVDGGDSFGRTVSNRSPLVPVCVPERVVPVPPVQDYPVLRVVESPSPGRPPRLTPDSPGPDLCAARTGCGPGRTVSLNVSGIDVQHSVLSLRTRVAPHPSPVTPHLPSHPGPQTSRLKCRVEVRSSTYRTRVTK